MRMFSDKLKKLLLLFFLCFNFLFCNSQQLNWLVGIWRERGSQDFFSKNIIIDSVYGNEFTGITVIKQRGLPVVITLSGAFSKSRFYFKNGLILSGEESIKNYSPECIACIAKNKIIIKEDSLILSSSVEGCNKNCNGINIYYKLLYEYDTITQLKLVKLFGSRLQIASFSSHQHIEENHEAVIRKKQIVDSIENLIDLAKFHHQRVLDSITFENDAREKRLHDSIKAITKKEQWQIQDSLETIAALKAQHRQKPVNKAVASLKQQHIADSIAVAKQQKKHIDSLKAIVSYLTIRRKEVDDSLQQVANNTKLKEQQRIKDSVSNAAALDAKRKQYIIDSLKNSLSLSKKRQKAFEDSIAAVKERQQQVADSLLIIARLKKQQHIKDSLILQQHIEDSTAAVKKRQKHIEDLIATFKKRQQKVEDSLQKVEDSLQNVARIQEHLGLFSLNEVAARLKQQHTEDSIATVKKRKQQIEDSLQNVTRIQEQRRQDSLNEIATRLKQQHIADSIAEAKKHEQQVEDSLQNVAKSREQQKQDSLNDILAKKRQKQIADSLDNIAMIKVKRTEDSLNRATAANQQQVILDSIQTASAKEKNVLKERSNVLLGTYNITSPDMLVELFDNAEVDGDRISVYHNNSLIVSNKELSTKAITFTVHADTLNRLHEFTMVAENLGTIPPNSALMRITVNKQVYKIFVTTDLKTNAKIVFNYIGN